MDDQTRVNMNLDREPRVRRRLRSERYAHPETEEAIGEAAPEEKAVRETAAETEEKNARFRRPAASDAGAGDASLRRDAGRPDQPDRDEAAEKTEGEDSEYAGRANWWLRTAGAEQYSAAFGDRDGSIYEAGADVSHETFCGIRPAVRVKIPERR